VTLSDLAKYSMTQSIARPLCDSRTSCYQWRRHEGQRGAVAPNPL